MQAKEPGSGKFGKALALLGAMALIAGIGSAGWRVGSSTLVESSRGNGLTVDASQLDFGEVLACPDFQWRLSFRNMGRAVIRINDIQVSCACAAIEPRAFLVPPGATRNVTLTLDLTTPPPVLVEDGSWKFALSINPLADERIVSSRGVVLKGLVRPLFTCEPPRIDLSELDYRQPVAPLTVRVTAARPIQDLLIQHASPLIEDYQVQRSGEASFDLILRFAPPSNAGPISEQLQLTGQPVGNDRTFATALGLRGRVVNDVEPDPGYLAFGAIDPGTDKSLEIVLRSRTGQPFRARISRFENLPESAVIVDAETYEGSEVPLKVAFHPPAAGHHKGAIELAVTEMGTGRAYSLRIPVLAYASSSPNAQ